MRASRLALVGVEGRRERSNCGRSLRNSTRATLAWTAVRVEWGVSICNSWTSKRLGLPAWHRRTKLGARRSSRLTRRSTPTVRGAAGQPGGESSVSSREQTATTTASAGSSGLLTRRSSQSSSKRKQASDCSSATLSPTSMRAATVGFGTWTAVLHSTSRSCGWNRRMKTCPCV
eukprot:scaffold83396_cov28-Tisochrysis_lutea.AAC.7